MQDRSCTTIFTSCMLPIVMNYDDDDGVDYYYYHNCYDDVDDDDDCDLLL